MVEAWRFEDGSLLIGATDYTQKLKEISVGGGDAPVELIRTAGNGQYINMQPINAIEIELTTHKIDTDFAYLQYGGAAVSTTGSALEVIPRTPVTLQYDWYDLQDVSGAQLRIKCASAYPAGRPTLRGNVTDALEETSRFVVPPKYYQENYTSDRATSPIT